MKKFFYTLLGTLCCASVSQAAPARTTYSPRLKVSPDIWRFRTQGELRQLILRSINNPRACYYIMNTAYARRMEVPAALVFQKLQAQAPTNPQRQIIYAYALFVAGGPESRSYWNKTPQNASLADDYGIGLSWLDAAIHAKPTSPELQLMATIPQADELSSLVRDSPTHWKAWNDVLARLRHITKVAPSWADAHFWYGHTLVMYYSSISRSDKYMGREYLLTLSEKSLLRAQSIDPGLVGDCARMLNLVANCQNQKAKELKYLDIWHRYQPGYKSDPYWIKRRATLVKELSISR